MKLIFLKYNPYDSDRHYLNSSNLKAIKAAIKLLPPYFENINDQWDSTCRPDPDFHPSYPSTGLCRNKKGGLQDYLKGLISKDHLIFYFYEKTSNGTSTIIISAVFQVAKWHKNHVDAYNHYINISPNSLPLNIVTEKIVNANRLTCTFTRCISNIVNISISHPTDKCYECFSNYYKKGNYSFIQYKWMVSNDFPNAGVIAQFPKVAFFNFMRANNAVVTSKKGGGSSFGNKNTNGIFENNFKEIQSGGIEIETNNITISNYSRSLPKLYSNISKGKKF